MKYPVFYISFLCLFLVGMSSFAQSRKELENRRKKLKNEIEQVNNLLFKTKKKKSSALDDLKDLNQKISVRKRLIETIELETKLLSKEIKSNEQQLKKYNDELKKLKDDYRDMVVKSYKSKSQQSKTMFLLSSESFYQAYKRLKYMQQYKDFRKKQGEEIMVKAKEVAQLNDSLTAQKKSKEVLLSDEKNQKEGIEEDKKDQEQLISKIKKEEKKYKSDLQKKQREEKKVLAKIDKLIRDAIAKANKGKKTTTSKKSNSGFILNAEEKTLLANFEQNKGNLPWPVKGVITRKFGVQPHPTFPGISINSHGLYIATKANTDVKSIFNGKVLVIQLHSDGRKSVLVQHGDYISTYNKLKEIYVKKGDVVRTGEILGKVFTNKVTGKTQLSFMLYKNRNRLNPAQWIRS
ncbi:murein hydrolase activator EnvC family protein [Tenacibaculum sediminilitoris]|uniref:murein hydrolase activator EnvC family protein n=1 Tax=Tenacibaculum sediminilitoris TaxID=1820334 RepID=UPI0038B555E0